MKALIVGMLAVLTATGFFPSKVYGNCQILINQPGFDYLLARLEAIVEGTDEDGFRGVVRFQGREISLEKRMTFLDIAEHSKDVAKKILAEAGADVLVAESLASSLYSRKTPNYRQKIEMNDTITGTRHDYLVDRNYSPETGEVIRVTRALNPDASELVLRESKILLITFGAEKNEALADMDAIKHHFGEKLMGAAGVTNAIAAVKRAASLFQECFNKCTKRASHQPLVEGDDKEGSRLIACPMAGF